MSPGTRPSASLLVVGMVAIVVAVCLSLLVGDRAVSGADLRAALTAYDPLDPDQVSVRTIRLPRTLLAVLVGAALSVSGALVQTLTRNPLAEPGLLGVTAGASFAVVAAEWMLGAGDQTSQFVAAALGAGVAATVVFLVGRADPLRLVLAGVALAAVLAGLSLGLRLLESDAFDAHRYWSVGSLSGREQTPLLLPTGIIALALGAALLLSRALAAIALGEDVAHGLGVHVTRTRVLTLLVATLLAGIATAVAGPIVFVGLIVPHLLRPATRGSVPWLMVLCLVFGPLLLILSDVLARLVLPTGDVPVAIITAVLGGPVLIWVVRGRGAGAL